MRCMHKKCSQQHWLHNATQQHMQTHWNTHTPAAHHVKLLGICLKLEALRQAAIVALSPVRVAARRRQAREGGPGRELLLACCAAGCSCVPNRSKCLLELSGKGCQEEGKRRGAASG